MAKNTFQLSVVTPEGAALECEARSAVFPAYDGEIGILPNHAPLVCRLGIGVLRVETADGERQRLYVDGGFAQVTPERLTLLTEQAQPLDSLSRETAEQLLSEAQEMTGAGDAGREARDTAYERARVQLRLTRGGANLN